MRIVQALTAPRGVLGLTLLAFTLAFVALVLDQADYKSPVLVYVFGFLAGITALGALAAFFGPRVRALKRLWPFALAHTARQLRAQLRETHDKIEQLEGHNEGLRTERDQFSDLQHERKRENSELKQEIQRLKANPDELKRYCSHVAAELSTFDRELRNLPGSDLRVKMDYAETEDEVNALKAQEQEVIRRHTAKMIDLYHKRHKGRIMELYGALAPRWFDEGDRELFENVADWPDVQHAAERIRTICQRLLGD